MRSSDLTVSSGSAISNPHDADVSKRPFARGGGVTAAVANGVRLGRKATLTHHQQQEAIKRRNTQKETLGEIARSYNVSRWTIARL